jgi:hypothetical protein
VAAGDFKISKDDGAITNTATTTPTEIAASSGVYYLPLSATEMQAANIVIRCVDQTATKEWEDQIIIIDTYGNASAEHAMDFDDAVRGGMTALPNAAADAAGGLPISDAGGLDLDAILADTNELQGDWTNGGRLDLILDAIQADTNELQTDDVPGLIAALNDFDPTSDKVFLGNGAHGGGSATLTLDNVTINRDSGAGAALTITASNGIGVDINATDGDGINVDSNQEGIQITSTGGHGVQIATNASNSRAVDIASTGSGSDADGVRIVATNGYTERQVGDAWYNGIKYIDTYDVTTISDFGTIDNSITAIETDTGTTLDDHLTDIKGTGFVKDTNSLVNMGGGDATEAKQDAIITDLDDIKGTGFVKDTNSLTNLSSAGTDVYEEDVTLT